MSKLDIGQRPYARATGSTSREFAISIPRPRDITTAAVASDAGRITTALRGYCGSDLVV